MLAGGLHGPECGGQTLPHHLERRLAQAEHFIDLAESATASTKARRRLRRVALLLEKTAGGVDRLGRSGKITTDCAAGLDAMFVEGERRARALVPTL